MLAAGLLIIKWIGIVLLGILGLVLTLILLILSVPVRYRAKGSYYTELKGKAGVSWLLHILSFTVIYDGEPDVAIRIFGIRIKNREKTDDTDFDEKPGKRKREPAEAVTKERPEPEAAVSEAQDMPEKPMAAEEPPAEAVTHEDGASRRKILFSFRRFCDKLKETGKQKDEILGFLGKEENKASFKLAWKQLKALLKHILPTRMKGKIRFGFEDPYTTGRVLMYVSPFYGLYAKSLTVIPVFEDAVTEGELSVKGRVRIGTALFRIGLLALDKNIRILWRELMNH